MTSQARKAIRARMKALRLDDTVDPEREFAGQLLDLIKSGNDDNPGEWSEPFAEFVINRFADQYVALCRVAPIHEKAGAR
jgi:hypothetical protein